jgi:hypothetical protein
MHIETQTKLHAALRLPLKSVGLGMLLSLAGCSFVELQPGAHSIIFANASEDCERISTFVAEVKTTTLFMERDPKVIAEELQTLAQNEAFQRYANAIWPVSDVSNGIQSFDILRCKPLSE